MGGMRRLWLLCALALLALVVGPSVLFATGSLAVANAFARALPVQLVSAFAGSLIGLVVGFVVAVYVLGVW